MDEATQGGELAVEKFRTQREGVVLHYWQGQTLAQVAVQLGRTIPAVAGLLQRGLKCLRTVLAEPE